MTELAVPEDPGGEFRGVAPTVGGPESEKSTCLVLSDDQRQLEAMLGSALALEFGRVAVLADSRCPARYAAQVVDNSRALSAGNARSHTALLRGQLRWLRSLPMGSSELQW